MVFCLITWEPKSFLAGSDGKESTCNAGDLGSIPRLGWSPEERNGYSFHYSCLENSTDRGARQATVHRVTKSRTQLSNKHNNNNSTGNYIQYPVVNITETMKKNIYMYNWMTLLYTRYPQHCKSTITRFFKKKRSLIHCQTKTKPTQVFLR